MFSAVAELQRLRAVGVRLRRRILFGAEEQCCRDSLLVLGRRFGYVRCGSESEAAAAGGEEEC